MNDTTNTKDTANRPSAKIYQFPDRRRALAAEAPKAETVPWCGGWYHEVAIGEERAKPASGPAA